MIPLSEVKARLTAGEIESGLWNCHHHGLHSIVLETRSDGSLLRIFFTSPEHQMGKVFNSQGHFIIGAHNHDKPCGFAVLYGDIWNVDLSVGIGRYPLYRYRFPSGIDGNGFTLGEPRKFFGNIRLEPIDGKYMSTKDIHTVLVATPKAAWVVDERVREPVAKYIYSPKIGLSLDANGLYGPMTASEVKTCADEVLALC